MRRFAAAVAWKPSSQAPDSTLLYYIDPDVSPSVLAWVADIDTAIIRQSAVISLLVAVSGKCCPAGVSAGGGPLRTRTHDPQTRGLAAFWCSPRVG